MTDKQKEQAILWIDGREALIEGERNVLEVARKVGVDIPTFCYHSELSIYGACRLCLVDIDGRGVVASCSTAPAPGMVVRTNTEEIRAMRKVAVELLLANHEMNCPTCAKSATCKLLNLARRLGVEELRYKSRQEHQPVDRSSDAIVRDPNKCILCGDCVRACHEIQGVGAIDFAYRGASSAVLPAFGKDLAQVECVNCGQCAAVCPTGALTVKSEIDLIWGAIHNPEKTVVVQMAPAVRAGLGEYFGKKAGKVYTGQAVAALKALGFDKVYDTSFTADLTVIEEANEFLKRFEKGEKLPQFTSCCPAWVKFAEQYYPDLLENLSSCKSPQQMFGSVARRILPAQLAIQQEDLVVVSLMPCTAKKAEAKLEKFQTDGQPDVNHVMTTQELGLMIEEAGLDFFGLAPESFDMPLGFKTGAGVIFGASGGVTEAVVRYAAEKVSGELLEAVDFEMLRGQEGLREATLEVGGVELRLAIVHSLANARKVAEEILAGNSPYHLIEVMACPGGCVNGAGQPVSQKPKVRQARAKALYHDDKAMQLHKSQENPEIVKLYEGHLGKVGGHDAHELLHTAYQNRRRLAEDDFMLVDEPDAAQLRVSVCVGTTCFLNGSQELLRRLTAYIREEGLQDRVRVQATFCLERCGNAPNVKVGDEILSQCTWEKALAALRKALSAESATASLTASP